jgi:hypothetical protein
VGGPTDNRRFHPVHVVNNSNLNFKLRYSECFKLLVKERGEDVMVDVVSEMIGGVGVSTCGCMRRMERPLSVRIERSLSWAGL